MQKMEPKAKEWQILGESWKNWENKSHISPKNHCVYQKTFPRTTTRNKMQKYRNVDGKILPWESSYVDGNVLEQLFGTELLQFMHLYNIFILFLCGFYFLHLMNWLLLVVFAI